MNKVKKYKVRMAKDVYVWAVDKDDAEQVACDNNQDMWICEGYTEEWC